MKKIGWLSLCLVVFICTLLPQKQTAVHDEDIRREKLLVKGAPFIIERGEDFVRILDQQDRQVFFRDSSQKDSKIIGVGFSKNFNCFFSFRERIHLQPLKYDLILEFDLEIKPVKITSPTPFYTPHLLEENGKYIVYITENFTLEIFDLDRRRSFKTIVFDTPIMQLRKDRVKGAEVLRFRRFFTGKYKNVYYRVADLLGSRKPSVLIDSQAMEGRERGSLNSDFGKRPARIEMDLDYSKIVGFGDSITYGQLAGEYAPDKGYIPRLEILVDEQLYDADVVNEGVGSRRAVDAVEDFETAIFQHKGKFLLFHLGTNDAVFPSIPVSSVTFSIHYMINQALQYDIQPIISTLIPRNTKHIDDIKWQRALDICDYVKDLSFFLSIPYVDFWEIFSTYPQDNGGYMSLMSDHVHPNEKGYQLMAEEWLRVLLILPPVTPQNVTIGNISSTQGTISWSANQEPDLTHYLIRYGYAPNRLWREVLTQQTTFTFTHFLLHSPFYKTLYFQVLAVDSEGNLSIPTIIGQITFE